MSAPRLNRRLTLETMVRTADGAGGFAESWEVLGDVWAEVTPGTGTERAGETAWQGAVPFRIVLRAAPEASPRRPKAGQRLRDGGRMFRILSVAEADTGQRYLICFAREEVVA